MDDVLAVDVLHSLHQLGHVVTSLRLCHRHPALEDVNQRLPGAVLQHDVDVVSVLKVLEELYYVFVSERAMKLNFTGNFFLVMRLGDPRFVDDLGCEHSIRFEIDEFMNAGKTSLQ